MHWCVQRRGGNHKHKSIVYSVEGKTACSRAESGRRRLQTPITVCQRPSHEGLLIHCLPTAKKKLSCASVEKLELQKGLVSV